MQKLLTSLVLIALILGGTYVYQEAFAGCQIPLTYSVGQVDSRFDITFDEVRSAVADAEAVWEDATGKNIFSYQETGGTLTINFFFDERQEFAVAEEKTREEIDEAEKVNEEVNRTYASLFEEYKELETQYKNRVATYERNLAQFEQKVATYEAEGGAPSEVFMALQDEQRNLDQEVEALNGMTRKLNALSDKINEVSEEGNKLIDKYNETVQAYNSAFGESREFTQGDYSAKSINIYKFSDRIELVAVLAHELGHALSIDHVEGEESVMYYLMGEQPEELKLTDADMEAFLQICQERTGWLSFLPF